MSEYSIDDAYNVFLGLVEQNNLMSLSDIATWRTAHGIKSGVIESNEVEFEQSLNNRSGDTYVYGTLQWRDDMTGYGTLHPLRRIRVELYDYDIDTPSNQTLLGYTYTNDDGYYSIGFVNNPYLPESGYDVFVKIYADGENVTVRNGLLLSKYSYMSIINMNVSTGSNVQISTTFDMSTNMGKALQISQAAITASDFYEEMTGNTPGLFNIYYPRNSSSYKRSGNYIDICGTANDEDYADWDIIMHEYGHFASTAMNLNQSPGSGHELGENMADHYAFCNVIECDIDCAKCHVNNFSNYKINGMRIAWQEGWATIFGEVAQHYFQDELSGVPYIANGLYENYNSGYSPTLIIYNTVHEEYGDACEGDIIGVLWDLFDIDQDDSISLDIEEWWDVTTQSGITDFSEFVDYFYQQYPEYLAALGDLLTSHHMASAITTAETTTLYSNIPPTITWDAQGGSEYYPNNKFKVTIYNRNYSANVSCSIVTTTSYTLTTSEWSQVLSMYGSEIHISVTGWQTTETQTGGYMSRVLTLEKPEFRYGLDNNNKAIITGSFYSIETVSIPATIDGYDVIGISDYAFYDDDVIILLSMSAGVQNIGTGAFRNCSSLTVVGLNNSTNLSIGNYAFQNCSNLEQVNFPSSVVSIGAYAFDNAGKVINLPKSVGTIGTNAFANLTDTRFILTSNMTNIGADAFYGCSSLTLYAEPSSRPTGWNTNFNSSNRPVIWGCTLSNDKSYVVSFVKSASNPQNPNATNGISKPHRSGYNFGGWYTNSSFTGTQYMDITTAPNGTLYAKWTEQSSCVAAGTMVTLSDGTRVAVETLTGNENLLVWNMLTGTFDYAPILFIDSDPMAQYEIIKLMFEDGTEVKVISEHAFWDVDLNKYVFLRSDAASYIGHYFNKQTWDNAGNMTYTSVRLTNVIIGYEYTTAWSPVTVGHLCLYVNGMLSMPGATEGLINIFEVDSYAMSYDQDLMETDIETYGLLEYDVLSSFVSIPYDAFCALNGQYLNVSIGKGLITLSEIIELAERYLSFF